MAELCSHFSSKASLIHVISRYNKPEIPNVTACTACHPGPMCSVEELFGEIHFFFPIMCSEDTMIHLTSNKMRNANFLRNIPTAVLPCKFVESEEAVVEKNKLKIQAKWKKKQNNAKWKMFK